MPVVAVLVWVTSALGWWAFAFMPLPSAPPAWLAAARYACFGATARGLPAAEGWMLLVLAPAASLAGILLLWGPDLPRSVARAARTPAGRGVALVLAAAIGTEAVWVTGKVSAALAVPRWSPDMLDDGPLPDTYPRQSIAAPDFSLVDERGRTTSLRTFRGTPVVVTFVFAHCQTTCPLIVSTLKRAASERTLFEVLLVTVDPWRDTPSALAGIARRWDLPANFHVLSSRAATDVLRVAEVYGIRVERNDRSGDVVHPGLVFIVDARGQLVYTFNAPPSAWIREALDRLGRTDALGS